MGDYWPIGGHMDKGAKMAVCAVGKHVFFLIKNEMARKSVRGEGTKNVQKYRVAERCS